MHVACLCIGGSKNAIGVVVDCIGHNRNPVEDFHVPELQFILYSAKLDLLSTSEPFQLCASNLY